ncbi:KTSC domain-containing protein [Ectobacillus panaciterrae]|uniref:KTSC domain-containing protein n=1 Tax=Ectobacillus panaciterrae TaxID=363872 RepID=UPI0009D6888A|nr:KTSC domain-containing protein [Ectobacillus panaciterrae]
MTMQSVISSKLIAVGYNTSSMILRIQFKNGTYDYYDVPEHIYTGLMNAASHSRYHSNFIKNSYRYTRIH